MPQNSENHLIIETKEIVELESIKEYAQEIPYSFNEISRLDWKIIDLKQKIDSLYNRWEDYRNQYVSEGNDEDYRMFREYSLRLEAYNSDLLELNLKKHSIVNNIRKNVSNITDIRDKMVYNFYTFDGIQGKFSSVKNVPQSRLQSEISDINNFFSAYANQLNSIGIDIPELVSVTPSYDNDDSRIGINSMGSSNSSVLTGSNSSVGSVGEQDSHTKDKNIQSGISAVAVIGKDKSSLGTMYTANGYGYATDSNGRIVYACAESLRMALGEERVRNYKSQLTVGGKDRFLCDKDGNILPADGSHLFAVIFGGSPFNNNMVAMDRYINRSVYKRLENAWAKAIAEGYDVKVELHLPYTNDRERPDAIMATYTFTKDGQSDTQHFSITNDDPRQGEYELTDDFEGHDSLAGLTDEQRQAYQEAYDYATSKVGKEIYSKESTTHIIHSDGSNITSYMGFTSKSENAGGSQDSSSKSIDDKE